VTGLRPGFSKRLIAAPSLLHNQSMEIQKGAHCRFQLADSGFQMPESVFSIIIDGVQERRGRLDDLGFFLRIKHDSFTA
jgi:hypothetical protein